MPARPRRKPRSARPKFPPAPAPARPSPADADASPAPVGADSIAARPADGADRPEWCSVLLAPLPRGGEFQLLAVEKGGRRKVVARSEPFRTPLWCRILPLRRLPNLGAPRRAHDLLVKRLVASGWQQMQTRGRWYDTAVLRTRPGPQPVAQERAIIGCRRGGPTAQFYAEALDAYGNVTSVVQSEPFSINPWSIRVRPTYDARTAHERFLEQLSSGGWASAGEPSSEWYAQVLQRPRS